MSILGNQRITPASSVSAMRKEYLLISRLIHPDKIGREFGMATKAFQLLVSAYEGLSQPDLTKADMGKAKGKTLSRSNEGCFVTPVHCPRCGVAWGQGRLPVRLRFVSLSPLRLSVPEPGRRWQGVSEQAFPLSQPWTASRRRPTRTS